MYQAAFEGDWLAAQILLQEDPNLLRVEITQRGDTALHVAVANKQTIFIRKLVERMYPKDLLLKNAVGYTSFFYAAATGDVEIASVLMQKNESLISVLDGDRRTPMYVAASLGHKDMFSYLYQFTRLEDLADREWFDILQVAIEKRMYDLALAILEKNESLTTMTVEEESGLRLLAHHDISYISSLQEAFWKGLVSMFAAIPCLSWLKRICEQPLIRKRAWLLAQKLIVFQLIPELLHQFVTESPCLHDAAKIGNIGFITMLTRNNPDLIFALDRKGRTIFHIAVLARQESVFSLIHHIGAMKQWILMVKDKRGDDIWHLAQQLAAPGILKNVPGAALQMQREIMWYKEVKNIVPISCLKSRNKQRQLPTEFFSQNHKQLLKDGEKGMKAIANSCMLTATLTATVVFAAAFTVPGGTNENTGTPILLGRGWFTVFMVSDAAAMFFSTFSIIMFLAILTSRFQEDDFLVSLPRKLIFGLTILFASIVSTIVAFTSTCILLFIGERTWVPILFATIACFLLAIMFIRMHFKLWIDTFRLTYLSRSLFSGGKSSIW